MDKSNKVSGSPKNCSSKACEICEEKISKYCCPRCEIYYCSLDCYRAEKHSVCSENYYRNCVNEELAQHQPDEESRNSMKEILERLQQESVNADRLLQSFETGEAIDSDDDNYYELTDRIDGLNLDDSETLWNALTFDEGNEFEALVHEGDVESFIPRWTPWWSYSKEEKLVEEITNKDKEIEAEHLKTCPKLVDVPKLSSLTNIEPSESIRFNVANVLASYAFVMRYLNGDIDSTEFTLFLLDICSNLNSNTNFNSPSMSFESVSQNCLKSGIIQTENTNLDIMKHDTFLLIRGPSKENKSYYCKSALSHIITVFTDAKKQAKTTTNGEGSSKGTFSKKFPEHTKENMPKLDINKIKKCIKKIEYYLAYVQSRELAE